MGQVRLGKADFRSVIGVGVQPGRNFLEIAFQLFVASRVGAFLDHAAENGLEKTVVFGEGELIVGGEGRFDGVFGGGSNEFEAADEDAGGCGWRGRDAEGQNGVDEAARNDVDEAGTLFEPGIFPGFEHGVGLVGEEALGNKDAFESGRKGIERGGELQRSIGGLIVERAEHAVADLRATALEQNGGGDFFGE